jgi:hypothetical protein
VLAIGLEPELCKTKQVKIMAGSLCVNVDFSIAEFCYEMLLK